MTRKMKDSGIEWIGEIPEEWEVLPARYFFKANKKIVGHKENEYERLSLTMKGVLKKSKYNSEGLQPSNFNSYQILTKNQLVFKLIDLQNVSTSRVGISPYKGLVSPAYIIIDRKDTKTNNRFYYYWYMSMYLNKVFNLLGDAGVRSNINATELLELKVPRTNFREQNIISDFLDKKTEQIENTKSTILQEIQTLEAYKKSVITEAVTKGLDKNVEMKDSGIEWIGEIPKNSKVTKLKYLVSRNITDGTHQTPEYADKEGGYPFLSSKDITKEYIDWSDIKYVTKKIHEKLQKEVQVQKSDILLAKNGTTGIAAIVDTDKIFDIYVTLALIRPDKNKVIPEYLLYAINSYTSKRQFNEYLLGIGVPNLHLNVIRNTRVLIHWIKNQRYIVDYLDKKTKLIDDSISIKKKQLETLEEYKKSLIYEYVTGKKEVKDGEET